MHGPINFKSPYNTSKWQMGFNLAFKGLNPPTDHTFSMHTAMEPSDLYDLYILIGLTAAQHTRSGATQLEMPFSAL
jgi:hypothetical protein